MFGGLVGSARQILSYGATVDVTTKGGDKLRKLVSQIQGLRTRFISLGVLTIFLDRLGMSLGRLWNGLSNAIGAVEAGEFAVQVTRVSEAIGEGTATTQAFTVAASDFGGTLESVNQLVGTLRSKMLAANNGSKQAVQLFEALGLSSETLAKKGGVSAILDIADALAGMDKHARQGVFGKLVGEGLSAKYLPMLLKGRDAVQGMMLEAVQTGMVLSDQQLAVARRFEESRGTFGRFFVGLRRNVAQIFLPAMTKTLDVLTKQIEKLTRYFYAVARVAGGSLNNALTEILDKAQKFGDVWLPLKSLPDTIWRLAKGLAMAGALIGAIVLGPFIIQTLLLAAAFIALAVVLEDVWAFFNGDESFLGELLKAEDSPFLTQIIGYFALLATYMDQARRLMVGFAGDVAGSTSALLAFEAAMVGINLVVMAFNGLLITLRAVFTLLEGILNLFASLGLAMNDLYEGRFSLSSIRRALARPGEVFKAMGAQYVNLAADVTGQARPYSSRDALMPSVEAALGPTLATGLHGMSSSETTINIYDARDPSAIVDTALRNDPGAAVRMGR